MAGSTCTFALKIAGTSDFLAVLQLFVALYVVFFGYVVEKELVCFSFVSTLQQIGLSNCH
jgi:hypothetical protein